MERLIAHQSKTPEPIEKTCPDAPANLVAIINRMTAKRPENRYSSGKEVSEVLDKWLQDHANDSKLLAMLGRGRTRAVPRGHHEPTRAKSTPSEETELELAPLDDDEKSSPKKPGSSPGKKAKQPQAASGTAQSPKKKETAARPGESSRTKLPKLAADSARTAWALLKAR